MLTFPALLNVRIQSFFFFILLSEFALSLPPHCLRSPPCAILLAPSWAQSACLARTEPCCAPALDKLPACLDLGQEPLYRSMGVLRVCMRLCTCWCVCVYSTHREGGPIRAKGLPPSAPSPCALLRPKGA